MKYKSGTEGILQTGYKRKFNLRIVRVDRVNEEYVIDASLIGGDETYIGLSYSKAQLESGIFKANPTKLEKVMK